MKGRISSSKVTEICSRLPPRPTVWVGLAALYYALFFSCMPPQIQADSQFSKVDQILDLFGDASAERATKRLLDRLQLDVNACSQSGQKTKKSFSKWRENTQNLYRGLTSAQSDFPFLLLFPWFMGY